MQARYEPVDLAAVTAELASVFRSAVERAGLRLRGGLPAAARAGVRRPRHVGEGRPQPAQQRAEVHLRRRASGSACGAEDGQRGGHRRRHRHRRARRRRCRGCSSGSTGSRTPAPAPTRAAASAWPWSGNSSGCTAAPSPPTASPGEGTTFTVRLPFGSAHLPRRRSVAAARRRRDGLRHRRPVRAGGAALAARRPAASRGPAGYRRDVAPAAGAGAGRRPARVLVADDNADMREYLTRLLRRRATGRRGRRRAGRAGRGPRRACRTWSSAT